MATPGKRSTERNTTVSPVARRACASATSAPVLPAPGSPMTISEPISTAVLSGPSLARAIGIPPAIGKRVCPARRASSALVVADNRPRSTL